MTKKRQDSRVSLIKYLKTMRWCIAFDPHFVAAKKNRKLGKSAVQKIDDSFKTPDSLGDDSSVLAIQVIAEALRAGLPLGPDVLSTAAAAAGALWAQVAVQSLLDLFK